MNTASSNTVAESPSKVLLVDDHKIVREGIAAILANYSKEFIVCGQASSSREAKTIAEHCLPDLIIADFFLGDGDDGTRLVGDLSALCPKARILVLSLSSEMTLAERVLRAGANGYLVKSEGSEKLLDACRTVLAGKRYVSQEFMAHVMEAFSSEAPLPKGSCAELSEREIQIYQLLGSDRSVSEIAERLGLSGRTVASHRENIKRKLNLHSAEAVVMAAKRWLQQTMT